MALAKVLKTARQNSSLIKLITLGFRKSEEKYPLNQESWIRASGLAEMCPREEVLKAIHQIKSSDVIEPGTSLIFLHGTALHWALQNYVMPTACNFFGCWKCMGCGLIYGGPSLVQDGEPFHYDGADSANLILRPEICATCGGNQFLYKEIWFGDKGYRVSGHPDGFLQLPGLKGIGVFEAKSIGDRFFWEVKNVPQMGHVVQIQTYLWLTGLTWGKILYWNKGGSGTAALKEHLVERDEDTILKLKSTVNSVWKGIAGGVLPEKICKRPSCARATKCIVVMQCFSDVPKREDNHPF